MKTIMKSLDTTRQRDAEPARCPTPPPTWKSAIQQGWKPALRATLGINEIGSALSRSGDRATRPLALLLSAAALSVILGCGGGAPQKQNRDFFTSGSREADQRASQRMARDEQLTGSG